MQTRAYSFSEDYVPWHVNWMYCKDIGQCPYKRMSTVQDTIQLQADTVLAPALLWLEMAAKKI